MPGTTVLCSTCNAHFDDNATRRQHMSAAWHVYNMKRRIVELAPISLEQYHSIIPDDHSRRDTQETAETSLEESGGSNPEAVDMSDSDDTDLADPTQCLFCLDTCDSVDESLEHMATTHGFHVPHMDTLETDVGTLLSYLQLVIAQFHACLYCGHEKQSAEATRAHMLSKGHCMLDVSPESDFRDFWQTMDSDLPSQRILSETEMRTSAGTVITSRQHQQSGLFDRTPARVSREVAIASSPAQDSAHSDRSDRQSTSRPTSRSLALRDQMGIVGLSDAQRRGLAVVQKKMMAREQRSRNEARWVLEKFGNKTKQKHFKPDVPGRKNG